MAIAKRCPACAKKMIDDKCVNPRCKRAQLAAEAERQKIEAEKAKAEQAEQIKEQLEQDKNAYFETDTKQ